MVVFIDIGYILIQIDRSEGLAFIDGLAGYIGDFGSVVHRVDGEGSLVGSFVFAVVGGEGDGLGTVPVYRTE